MSFWTEARIAELRRLAPDYTASQIAKIMHAPTRNIIIGKIHRMKLNLNRDKPRGQARPQIAFNGMLARRVAKWKSRPAAPTKPVQRRSRKAVDIWGLTADACRWPLFADDEPIFDKLYCGTIAVEKLPYCPDHCRLAFSKFAV